MAFLLVLAKFFVYWLAVVAMVNLMFVVLAVVLSGFNWQKVKDELRPESENDIQAFAEVQFTLGALAFVVAVVGLAIFK